MKAITTTLSTAAVLTAAASASGCSLDACVMLCIAVSSGIAGMLVNDYGRAASDPARAPEAIRRTATEHRTAPAQVYASVIIFNTTCA